MQKKNSFIKIIHTKKSDFGITNYVTGEDT